MVYSNSSPEANLPLDQTGEDPMWLNAMEYLRTVFDSTVAIDTDGTYFDPRTDQLRPGTRELFQDLRDAGNEVHLWTIQGREHVAGVVERHGLADLIDGFHPKPVRGMTPEATMSVLGFLPDVTVDDSMHDQVAGIKFVHVPAYYPPRNGA